MIRSLTLKKTKNPTLLKILRYIKRGGSIDLMARSLGVSRSTPYTWFVKDNVPARRVEQLKVFFKEIDKLRKKLLNIK